MKTFITCVCICLLMAISAPSWTSDLATLYPEKIKQAENLYPLAKAFFKGPGSLPPGETLTPEMIKNPERQQAYYQLRRLLGLAIDAGFDLSQLSEFGLVKEKQGYTIDFAQYPQWAPISSLFIQLREPSDLEYAGYYLQKKGLSSKDINRIKQFLATRNPKVEAIQAAQQMVNQSQIQFANKLNSQSKIPTQDVVFLHEQTRKAKHDSWHKWATSLLNMFPHYKQRIILDHLQENLGSYAMGKAPINSAYLQLYAKEVASGTASRNLSQTITEIRQRTK